MVISKFGASHFPATVSRTRRAMVLARKLLCPLLISFAVSACGNNPVHQPERPQNTNLQERNDIETVSAMLAELGFMGMMTAVEYGGEGMDTLSYVLAMEEISKIDASVSVVMSVQNSLVNWALEHHGTENQKRLFLAPMAMGQEIGAFAL